MHAQTPAKVMAGCETGRVHEPARDAACANKQCTGPVWHGHQATNQPIARPVEACLRDVCAPVALCTQSGSGASAWSSADWHIALSMRRMGPMPTFSLSRQLAKGSVQVLVQLADHGASQRFLQRSTASIQWLRLRAAQQAPATSTGVELLDAPGHSHDQKCPHRCRRLAAPGAW